MKAFGIETGSVRDQLKDVARYAVLHRGREGQLLIVPATGLLLEEGETTHWTCPAELFEDKVQKDGMTAKPSFFKIEDPEMVGAVLSQAVAVSRESTGRGKNG
jgi:hypothetical protein